jgi:hypothetical protein
VPVPVPVSVSVSASASVSLCAYVHASLSLSLSLSLFCLCACVRACVRAWCCLWSLSPCPSDMHTRPTPTSDSGCPTSCRRSLLRVPTAHHLQWLPPHSPAEFVPRHYLLHDLQLPFRTSTVRTAHSCTPTNHGPAHPARNPTPTPQTNPAPSTTRPPKPPNPNPSTSRNRNPKVAHARTHARTHARAHTRTHTN